MDTATDAAKRSKGKQGGTYQRGHQQHHAGRADVLRAGAQQAPAGGGRVRRGRHRETALRPRPPAAPRYRTSHRSTVAPACATTLFTAVQLITAEVGHMLRTLGAYSLRI